ncbi:MAG: NAD(P)H-hydrate epimerase [Nitriliruptor sp.]|uniref:NAD(P)H-hydrate epimerase n=1 Tax=Nitriliruptor sp. TaxID=2448056 RepID=UPI0034A05BD9
MSDAVPDGYSTFPQADLPDLTTEQMREVDRIMVDELHITLLQMMENAGRHLAELAIRRYRPATCTVLAGPGGNGGGGLAAARHLANRGVGVEVVLSAPQAMTEAPAHQLDILRRMSVPVVTAPRHPALVVDAVLGYSISGDPHGRAAELIRWANQREAPVLALDTPSGLDPTTGRAGTPCTVADATLTLALPKRGLRQATEVVGALFAADIAVPPSVYARFGINVAAPSRPGRSWRCAEPP